MRVPAARFAAAGPVLGILTAIVGGALALTSLLFTVLPHTGLYATFSVVSGSMEPAIPSGSVVIVAPVPVDQIRVGDVISYTSSSAPYPTLTHRVVRITQDAHGRIFKTKGDANAAADPWDVRYKGAGGKVLLTVPFLGLALLASESFAARLALGALLALLLAWHWLRAVWWKPQPAAEPESGSPTFQWRSSGHFSPLRAAILSVLVLVMVLRQSARRAAG